MATAAKHRHSVEGGYQRGEETRARIVVAALKLFGELGFEGASTRDIAASAGVNAPALQYYFDNKEGVYIACVEHIVARVWEYMGDVVGRTEELLAANASDEELIAAACDIQMQLAEFMFTAPDAEECRLFMARQNAGGGPPAGFQILDRCLGQRMSSAIAAVVGRLVGRPANDEETLLRAVTLTGQLTVFQVKRRAVLSKLNWDKVDGMRLALLKRIVREHTEILLRSMIEKRDTQKSPESAGRRRGR